ncbi:hypothetical protein [Dyadobacter psychrophilus]|uniref:RNA polymerase sigma-70 factor, ECF subfamily n=1 Tax=Dyadobacter psychrophilus TaxID=651661 RepID=A0A1T5G5X3_9BACT|nr:hypothetical protein [Dyadobacter psychrophilus]SKC03747.1 RNA polymerase sigma-70 factor, ECF subfamily [Dyadobacter psychrophilus]
MTAALCRHFGLVNIEVAEDIASETFPKASEYWAVNGVPENPTARLYTVAKKALSLIKSNIQKSALLKEITRLSQMINNA